ncbi:cilia- and flagella-associated protein 119 [Myripristis murdjan]|uniref:cilia- and flagella-associated protein 119 n=1 Tax=Myripristis murdjan TaxID=586833 RepID=UPI00117621D4|nr:coiled-coil domain-containing protein 189 [Myripristis murdjan]
MNLEAKIKLPHDLKPKILLWADVSYNDMEEIDSMWTIPDLERALCGVFCVDVPEPKRGVLLELYVHTVLFCRESSLNREQTSALLSIIKCIHQANTETTFNNMEQCFEYCGELLLCHSVRRPPFSVSLFSSEEVTHILKYIYNTYIRHHKLYKYIFTPQVQLDLSLVYSGMPEEDDTTMEDSAAPETESEAAQEKERLPETQETVTTEPEGATLGSRSELRAMIEQEFREEMMLVFGQLEQQLKDHTDQLSSTLAPLQPNLHGKK